MPTSPSPTKPLWTDKAAQSGESASGANVLVNSASISEIQKCLTLLEEGKSKVITNQTDIVSLLGMTGSGKTTLVKFLTTNNERLNAEEVAENIGEYVINDADEKMSSTTLASESIFPKLFRDPDTQIAFYDGPGFSNTHGLASDITGAYFMHKVITESQKIRFILTISYSSVRRGNDSGDFLELLKYVLHLIKNVDSYLDSMVLVVTKVDNQMMRKDGELVLVPDDIVLENIAKFLLDFKSNLPRMAHGPIAQDMSKLVDVFLRKKDSTYEKIALFRRPDEAGPISKIPQLQEAKAVIKKVIRENLKHSNVIKEDFGIAISEESKNKLYDVMAIINDKIASAIKEVCESKILIYEAKAAESKDIYEVHEMLRLDFETLRNWLANKSEDLELPNFLDDLLEVSKNMKARFNDEEKSRILDQNKYVSFLETINGKKFKGSATSWKMGLLPYLDYLKESTKWYKFLTVWHTVLSSYPVQKIQNDFSRLLEHPVTNLNDEQFVKLLIYCKTLTNELNDFQFIKMNSAKVDQFNRLLERTLKSDTIATYDEKKKVLEVRGKFVKLSEHLNIQKNLAKAHFINVFASEKLFVDANFNRLNDNLQTLYLAAPTLEVIGTAHIKLDGEKGCCKPYTAQDGDRYWRNGHKGKPGMPGKSAANFMGLANTIINGEYLKITANGGDGAAGQDGGNGDDGHNGESPITKYSWGCVGGDFNRFASKRLGGQVRRVYCVYGERGGDGGNGGDGGAGGYGGYPGKIVFPLRQPLNVKTEAKKGIVGPPGLGGKGGEGGKAGRSWNHQKMLWWWRDAVCSRSKRLADEYGDCADTDFLRDGHQGHRGLDGVNSGGAQEAGYTDLVDSDATVEEYRQFLQQESKNDIINQLSKMEFLNKLDTVPKLKKLSNFNRYKRMAKSTGQRFKRHGPLDKDRPKWISNDCFQGPQWPIIGKIGQSQGTTDIAVTSLPFTDLLLLTDLLIRKLNQTKPNYFQSCTVDDIAVTGCAIHILSIFEKTLTSIHGVKDGEPIHMSIDPVIVIEKLEKEIRNGSPQNITKILLDSLDGDSEHKEELSRLLIAELQIDSA